MVSCNRSGSASLSIKVGVSIVRVLSGEIYSYLVNLVDGFNYLLDTLHYVHLSFYNTVLPRISSSSTYIL